MMRFIIEKRTTKSKYSVFIVPLVSFAISLLLGAIVLAASKANPFAAYKAMFEGSFGNIRRIQYTLREAMPLLMCGLAVGIAFKLKFWNIGAEGQYVSGAIGFTWVVQFWTFLPPVLLLPVGLLMGIIAGGLWAGVPGTLKAQWGVDETLTTLMLNYVAIGYAEYLYIDHWKAPFGNMGTPKFPDAAILPSVWGRVHAGVFFALALVVILWFILYKTRWGFELNMIGKNPKAARYQGVSIKKNIIMAMLFSGAIAGLAGAIHTSAVAQKLTTGVNGNYGFTGIIIAWMGGLNPFGSIIVAIVMAALSTGAGQLQIALKLPEAMGAVLQGLVLLPLLAGSLFNEYHLRVIKKGAE
ncbi:MAG: ABC transporter permease [Sphaerochaetaceae bacterium]|nr:ABC transporter permease [Sphaerochaetaceae bacterium]MDD4763547.1 ABC transporter permease [Sphaerochaetaceae bacterium]